MSNRKPISVYKEQAREQLLGNYGMAVGAFALVFVCSYFLHSILMGAYNASTIAGRIVTTENIEEISNALASASISVEVTINLIALVSGIFYALLFTGYLYILKEISYGRKPRLSDVYYCFRKHPDKVIIISLSLGVMQIITGLPAVIVSYMSDFGITYNVDMLIIWLLLQLIGNIAYLYISIIFEFSYLIYLDNDDFTAIECLRKSVVYMKGNKLRYLGMILSLIGYYLLGVISMGIGMLYAVAYQNMVTINMYKDIKDHEDRI